MIRFLVYTFVFLAVLVGGFAAYVRYARVVPEDWNVPVATTDAPVAGPCADQVRFVPRGARATCLLPGTPAEVMAKLTDIAAAMPRTKLIASGETLATWESRSKLWGFPDYITAEVAPVPEGTRLDILSRQRFGGGDFGVNAARLRDWLSQL